MQDFSPLFKTLSKERLTTYRLQVSDPDRVVAARYLWNVALAESLYPLLQFVEVALRNAIHREMSGKFRNPFWFEDPLLVDARTLATAKENRRVLARTP